MKINLMVSIEMDYVLTEYEQLRKIAFEVVNLGGSKFLWVFRPIHIPEVIRLIGKPMEIDESDLKQIEPYAPPLTKELLSKARIKGKGKFEVIFKSPKIYIIKTIINAKEVKKSIPTENIKVLWEVMKEHPIGTCVESRVVWDNIMKKLGIERFNRQSGTFDGSKFFGERKDYGKYFYYPTKILQSDGVIIHHTFGALERTSENWELQTTMQNE